jgi:predicted nuclease with RNAse H fold
LIYRGIDLRNSIGREVRQSCQVIEVYPFASKARLFGKAIPRKTIKQGITLGRDKLGGILPDIAHYLATFNHDLCDAAVTAYIASLHYQNRADILGNNAAGVIFIPS